PSKFVGERYIHSEDGGATFAGELVLGPPTNLDYAAEAGGKFPGDYMGVTTSGRAAHAVWNVASRPAEPGAEYHQTTWSAVIRR
ncbi:MAG: hypothetical protein H0W94_01615, partial [Actinobacteria bacterium]|nr:hypothetical protein [Actinomycetota bacterium]